MLPNETNKISFFRNYTAVRAEKSLGAVRWGRSESDVIIMREANHFIL
jgi:hypothetical protein